jgi:hypothetical protein
MYTSRPSNWTWYFLIGLGLCFLAGAALVALFAQGGVVVAWIWTVLCGVGGYALWKQRDERDLLATGVKATATVIGVQNSGVRINGVPRFTIALRVDRPGAPFEAKIGALTYSPAAIGSVMDVCYDPKNVKHIAFVDADASAADPTTVEDAPAATASPGPRATVELLAQLDNLHQSGSLTDTEFAQAKREVLGES